MSNSLWPHGLQHPRLPCPSPTPGACSNSCLSSRWCHPTISSSIGLFSCVQSFPAWGSFPVSRLFASGDRGTGASASASSLSNEYSGLISYRIDWFGLLAVQGIFKSLLQDHSSKASILLPSAFFTVRLSHPCMTTGKTIALTRWTFVGKVISAFEYVSRLVITFLPRTKHLFNLVAAVTICSDFGAQKNKVWYCFHCFPIYFPSSGGTGCRDLRFLNVEL